VSIDPWWSAQYHGFIDKSEVFTAGEHLAPVDAIPDKCKPMQSGRFTLSRFLLATFS
jgi:hypothetical protein